MRFRFGIEREAVAVSEVAQLVSGPTEAREYLSARMIEDVYLLVAAVHHEEV